MTLRVAFRHALQGIVRKFILSAAVASIFVLDFGKGLKTKQITPKMCTKTFGNVLESFHV